MELTAAPGSLELVYSARDETGQYGEYLQRRLRDHSPALLLKDEWPDDWLQSTLGVRYPRRDPSVTASRSSYRHLVFRGLPPLVKNELKLYFAVSLTDERKHSKSWFHDRRYVPQFFADTWPEISDRFSARSIADIPYPLLSLRGKNPSSGPEAAVQSRNNPELVALYVEWYGKHFGGKQSQRVSFVVEDRLQSRKYVRGNLSVIGGLHAWIVIHKDQMKPLQARNILLYNDLYDEHDIRFKDRQKRHDAYVSLYRFPAWMRDAVRAHLLDKIDHDELGPGTLTNVCGRLQRFGDFLDEKYPNPSPRQLTAALVQEDFLAWGNRKGLRGKNWFTEVVGFLSYASRRFPRQWPALAIDRRAARKVKYKQARLENGRLYNSQEGAKRAIPIPVVEAIARNIHEAPGPVPALFVLGMQTGARAEDLHAFLFDCLKDDPHDERFVLLTWWQNKVRKWNTKPLLKADEKHQILIEAIEGQRRRIVDQYGDRTKYLFPVFHGRKESFLAPSWSSEEIKKICIRHCIQDGGEIYSFSWHPLRHFLGTQMALAGHDIVSIMLELGHQSSDMSMTYINRRLELKKKALAEKGSGFFVTIEGAVDAKVGELLVRKDASVATRVCGGACLLPGQLGDWCEHANACFACAHFRADSEDRDYFASLQAKLLATVAGQENEALDYEACGRGRLAELTRKRQKRNKDLIANLQSILSRIEEKGVHAGAEQSQRTVALPGTP